jgi:beta-lactam-binding protein with PASTA domain
VASIVVPDVRGLDGKTARDRLREAGITIVGQEAVNGKAVLMASMWQVVDQVPAAGTAIPAGGSVTLKLDRFKPTEQPEPSKQPDPPAQDEQPKEEPKRQEPPPEPVKNTDPKFGTCGEANANGYGDYQRGVHDEYDWYQDRDGDGRVCERR